jgi:hypothetical protein
MAERGPTVGLDELFETAKAPRERVTAPFSPRWWLWRVVAALLVAGAVYVVLYVVRVGVPYPLIATAVLAIMVLRGTLKLMEDDPLPPEVTGKGIERPVRREASGAPEGLRPAVAQTDGVVFAISRWDDRLNWGERDTGRFTGIVVPRVAELADERLRQRYGVTLAGDPARARALLGEDVWLFLQGQVARRIGPRDVASIVAKVEGL